MDVKELFSELPPDIQKSFQALPEEVQRQTFLKLRDLLDVYNRSQVKESVATSLSDESVAVPDSLGVNAALVPGNSFSKNCGHIRPHWLRLEISSTRESNQEGLGCLAFCGSIALFVFIHPVVGALCFGLFLYFVKGRLGMDDFLLADLNAGLLYNYSNENEGSMDEIAPLSAIVCLAVDAKRETNKNQVYYKHRLIAVRNDRTSIPLSDYQNRAFLEAIEFGEAVAKALNKPLYHGASDSDLLIICAENDSKLPVKFY